MTLKERVTANLDDLTLESLLLVQHYAMTLSDQDRRLGPAHDATLQPSKRAQEILRVCPGALSEDVVEERCER